MSRRFKPRTAPVGLAGLRMKTSRTFQIAIAVTAAVAAVAVALLILASDHVETPIVLAVLTVAAAGSYVVIGLAVMARRPANSIGPLLVAIGIAVLLMGLRAANSPGTFIAGALSSHVVPVLIVHLLMVFPSGRFESKFQRNIVALGYLDAFVLPFLAVLVFNPRLQCVSCPQNPLLLDAHDGIHQGITVARLTLDAFVTIGLATELTRRWYAAMPTQRALLAPVIWSGSATMAAFVVFLVSELAGSPVEVLHALGLMALLVSAVVPCAIAFGFVRGRFSRAGAVSDFVAMLTSDRYRNADLRDALAVALEDPSLEVEYWLPDRRCFVDADGQPTERPHERSGRLWHSIELNGELVAAIIHDASTGDKTELIQAAGGAAALSLENKRLEAELRAHVNELRLSRARIVEAADQERKRIERDLHDGAQQKLLSVALNLQLAGLKMRDDPFEASELFKTASVDLTEATEELRELARGIHPAVLTDRGLSGALSALADRIPLRVDVVSRLTCRLPSQVESTAYFVVAEALTNVARYANASAASVTVDESDGYITIEIRDDGIGGADPKNGTGLRGLADRVAAYDGRLEVRSESGRGTIVNATLRRDSSKPGEKILSAPRLINSDRPL